MRALETGVSVAVMHWWPRIQVSGTGLTLVSALAPTLGFEIPYSIRVAGFVVGLLMLVYPIIGALLNKLRQMGRERIPYVFAMIVFVAIAVGSSVLFFLHERPAVQRVASPASTPPSRISTATKSVFKCMSPVGPNEADQKGIDDKLTKWQNKERVLGEAVDLNISVGIYYAGGIVITISDRSDSPRHLIPNANTISIIGRRLDDSAIVVTVSNPIPELGILLGETTTTTNVSPLVQTREVIEQLFGVEAGKCQLL